MKLKTIFNILFLALLTVLTVWTVFVEPRPVAGPDAIGVIMTRTSIRRYEPRPVEPGKVDTLLRAAMAAPSAGNKQPWAFVVLTDTALTDSIARHIGPARPLRGAPLAIVVCADTTRTFAGPAHDFWVQDASAATENMLLAAHVMGLGAVWLGVYPLKERTDFIGNMIGLPAHVLPLGIVAVGYPAESPAPKDKWRPEAVHVGRW